jgi:hypothetical protein
MVEDVQCLINRHYNITTVVLTQSNSKLTNSLHIVKTKSDFTIVRVHV